MNRKQLIILLAILAVVGSAGWILVKQHRESWNAAAAKMGDKVLPNFQPNAVAVIYIKGVSELNVTHKNDLWRVQERNDYPANFGKVSDILIRLQGLKVVEAETVGPSQLARVNLDEPGTGSTGGTLVEFRDSRGKVLEALLLGRKHMRVQGEASHSMTASEPDGRYILLRSDPKTVLLISDALAGLDPNPEMWVSKDFFKAENVKSISLTAVNPANSWKIFHDTASSPWVLADAKPGEVLDAKRASMITNALSSPRFVDVASANSAGGGLDQPTAVAIETFDHFAYALKISAKGPDDNYRMTVNVTADNPAAAATGNADTMDAQKKNRKLQDKLKQEQALASWVYTINSWILDPVVRDRAQILRGYQDNQKGDSANTAASSGKKDKPAWTPRVIQ